MKVIVALALVMSMLPMRTAKKSQKNPAPQRTFEELSQGAMELTDVEKAVGPFMQTCGNTNDLPDLQCRAIRSFMQRRASRRTYLSSTSDALVFGEYDASKFVFPVTVMGCLSCTKPMEFDPVLFRPNKFYVTTKTPKAIKDGKLEGVELAKFELAVDPRKVGQWMKQVRPFLRVQFLYRVTPDGVWPEKLGHGFTLHTGGFRVYNRCTGEVLYSQPPSTGKAPIDRKGCPGTQKKVVKKSHRKVLPYISSSRFLAIMKKARPAFSKCYENFQIPGKSRLMLTIRGKDGRVVRVRIKGQFKNTPTGECLVKAAKSIAFPPFARARQNFTYVVILP